MAAVSALARSNSALPSAFTARRQAVAADSSAKLQKSLGTLFPDLLICVTRNALLSMTTSLTKISERTHQYFARVSQVLAFERMMRSFMQLGAAMSPFPMEFIAANCWSNLLLPGQPAPPAWANSAPDHRQQPAMTPFLANMFQPRRPESANDMRSWDYSPLFIVPMALLIAAPITENWWNFGF
jgi:hypothetical protein